MSWSIQLFNRYEPARIETEENKAMSFKTLSDCNNSEIDNYLQKILYKKNVEQRAENNLSHLLQSSTAFCLDCWTAFLKRVKKRPRSTPEALRESHRLNSAGPNYALDGPLENQVNCKYDDTRSLKDNICELPTCTSYRGKRKLMSFAPKLQLHPTDGSGGDCNSNAIQDSAYRVAETGEKEIGKYGDTLSNCFLT